MQLVTAVVKPHMLDEVKDALKAKGVTGITVSEVKGFGRQGGHTETYRGTEYQIDFVPKTRIDILTSDAQAEAVAAVITETARTGKIGDGKVWVLGVESVSRIRTGERDQDAL